MWSVQTEEIPVIRGQLEPHQNGLSNTPGNGEVKALNKTDTLGTAHTHTHTHFGEW